MAFLGGWVALSKIHSGGDIHLQPGDVESDVLRRVEGLGAKGGVAQVIGGDGTGVLGQALDQRGNVGGEDGRVALGDPGEDILAECVGAVVEVAAGDGVRKQGSRGAGAIETYKVVLLTVRVSLTPSAIPIGSVARPHLPSQIMTS